MTDAGLARAHKLASYIPEQIARPNFIVAAAISRNSARPYQTVKPLSDQVHVSIDATIADQDYGALAADLLRDGAFAGKTGVVCWHHGNIPSLLHALGAPDGAYPDPWDRTVFNLILAISFPDGVANVRQIMKPF